MADISAEITAFRNAVYGEDVRSAMISLANKLNDGLQLDISNLTQTVNAAANTVAGYDDSLNNINTSILSANNAFKELGIDFDVVGAFETIIGSLVGYDTSTYYPDIRTGENYNHIVLIIDLLKISDVNTFKISKPSSPLLYQHIVYSDLSSHVTNLPWNTINVNPSYSNSYISSNYSDDYYLLQIKKLKDAGYKEVCLEFNNVDDISIKSLHDVGLSERITNIDNIIYGYAINTYSSIVGLLVGYNTSTYYPDIRTGDSYQDTKVITITLSDITLDSLIISKPTSPLRGSCILYTNESSKATSYPLTSINSPNFLNKYISSNYLDDYYSLDINKLKNDGYTVVYLGFNYYDSIYIRSGNDSMLNKIKTIEQEISINTSNFLNLNMFRSVSAIGDSFTKTLIIKSDNSGVEMPECGWLATMAKESNTDYHIYAVSGATTRSILTEVNGVPKALSDESSDLYFYALGINDSEQLGQSYLGTINDITNDYTQNPDTFYGNYARIIEQLMNHSSNARHIMFKIPIRGDIYSVFNNAIEEIADHYSIPFIDPFDDWFYSSELYTRIMGHPTIVGYTGMGLANLRLFSELVENNFDYFKFSVVG